MKLFRLLPFCLGIAALPLVLTGCNRAADDANSTATDTNAAPATADTNTPPPAPATDTNTPPAAPAATTDTNAPAATNTPTGSTNSTGGGMQ